VPISFEQIEVKLVDTMGSDRAIAETAWTSSVDYGNKKNRTDDEVDKVVRFMAKHKHGTPFESVIFKFWMRIPIFTDRQIVTHRIASHNGLSGRYRTVPTDFYDIPNDVSNIIEKATLGAQHTGLQELWNDHVGHDKFKVPDIFKEYYDNCIKSMESYKNCLQVLKIAEKKLGKITNAEYKRAREIIRGQVPTAGMTERTTIINLRSFANFQKLRNSAHASNEHKHDYS